MRHHSASTLPLSSAALAATLALGGSASAATPLNVFDSADLNTPISQIDTISTAQTGQQHYDYRSASGHPTGVNLGPLTSNIWVHENATTGEFSFGFIFGKDGNAPSNKADFRFRIVGSTSTVRIVQGDEASEVSEPEPGVFSGRFSYGSNTDGVMVGGLTGSGWTVIIDSVDFGKVDTWYASNGATTAYTDDLPLTLGREYRITPTTNTVSSEPVDPNDSDGDLVPDTTDAYPCDGYAGGAIFVPAEDVHAALLFEDQWPDIGDADFNDAVIAYNYVLRTDVNGDIVTITATLNPLALGGIWDHGVGLHMPFPSTSVQSVTMSVGNGLAQDVLLEPDTEMTVKLVDNLRTRFGGQAGPINSIPGAALTGERIQVDIILSTPASPTIVSQAPFDVYLFRTHEQGHEVHRTPYVGTAAMDGTLFNTGSDNSGGGVNFVDDRGVPFVLDIPVSSQWPQEGVDIALLYPNILAWAASGGAQNQDFYSNGVVSTYAFSPAPAPTLAPDYDYVDISCQPVPGQTAEDAMLSCLSILQAAGGVAPDGMYWIDLDDTGPRAPVQTYCDMNSDGGGWTLVAISGDAASRAEHEFDGPQGAIDNTGHALDITGDGVAEMFKLMSSADIHAITTETMRLTDHPAGGSNGWSSKAFWRAANTSYNLFNSTSQGGYCKTNLSDPTWSSTSNPYHVGLQFYTGTSGGWQCAFPYQFSDIRWDSYPHYRNNNAGTRWWTR